MTEDVVLYRADVKGLLPGAGTTRMIPWYQNREYTYATSNLDVARAFAVYAFGAPRDHERSVYRVELDAPIVEDPDFRSDLYGSFYMSNWGTVVEVVEENVTMTIDEARQVFSKYLRRVDEEFLAYLVTYPEPNAVLKFLSERFPLKG